MLIIWDYFGVIAQDSFWYTAERLANSHGMGDDIKKAQIEADLGKITWDEYTKKVSSDIGVPVEQVRARYQEHDIKQTNIVAIHRLSEHTHVLLSNASSMYLIPVMKKLGLDSLFERTFVSSDIGYAKPDSRAFLHVLSEMKFAPHETVMIDDSARNIDSARELGMNGVVYEPGTDIVSKIHDFSDNIQPIS